MTLLAQADRRGHTPHVSQESNEVVPEAVAALNETYRTGDMGPWRRHVEKWADPELVLEAPTDAFIEGTWRGHDGVVSFVANQMEVLEGMWLRLDELIEAHPGCLVAVITFGGRARHSGLEVEMHPCHLFRMRDGKIHQWQVFPKREPALAAALGG
jgi:ketosteroid isomerase-like protein